MVVKTDPYNQQDCSLRDILARDRTLMANERTLLSYIRTSIMLFATGVTVIKLFPSSLFYNVFGAVIIGFGFFTFSLGVYRFNKMKRNISDAIGS